MQGYLIGLERKHTSIHLQRCKTKSDDIASPLGSISGTSGHSILHYKQLAFQTMSKLFCVFAGLAVIFRIMRIS